MQLLLHLPLGWFNCKQVILYGSFAKLCDWASAIEELLAGQGCVGMLRLENHCVGPPHMSRYPHTVPAWVSSWCSLNGCLLRPVKRPAGGGWKIWFPGRSAFGHVLQCVVCAADPLAAALLVCRLDIVLPTCLHITRMLLLLYSHASQGGLFRLHMMKGVLAVVAVW